MSTAHFAALGLRRKQENSEEKLHSITLKLGTLRVMSKFFLTNAQRCLSAVKDLRV